MASLLLMGGRIIDPPVDSAEAVAYSIRRGRETGLARILHIGAMPRSALLPSTLLGAGRASLGCIVAAPWAA